MPPRGLRMTRSAEPFLQVIKMDVLALNLFTQKSGRTKCVSVVNGMVVHVVLTNLEINIIVKVTEHKGGNSSCLPGLRVISEAF